MTQWQLTGLGDVGRHRWLVVYLISEGVLRWPPLPFLSPPPTRLNNDR